MKPNYLTRTATFNPDNISLLLAEETRARLCGDGHDMLLSITAMASLNDKLRKAIFGESEAAVTLTGEEFNAAAQTAVAKCADMFKDTAEEDKPSAPVCALLGSVVYAVLALEDKLYGSDLDKEEKADD